ncbi:MAG: hypothetical protein KJ939_02925 [Nanoarchaeota archaeon]|nr:hypothetical protein [Nanoarchaeota archaeon]
MKKAQTTMFIILGIVLITVIVAGFFLKDAVFKSLNEAKIAKSVALQKQVKDVSVIVEDCLESVTNEAAINIFAKGGYYEIENPILYTSYKIPIYYNKGKENVPSLEDIEKEISKYVESKLQICTNNFPNLKFTVQSLKNPKTTIKIAKNLFVELEWSIRLGDNEQATISEFFQELELNLKDPYEKSIKLYEEQKNLDVISLSDLAKLAKKEEYLLHFDFQEGAILYILTFEEIPLTYTFSIIPKETAF